MYIQISPLRVLILWLTTVANVCGNLDCVVLTTVKVKSNWRDPKQNKAEFPINSLSIANLELVLLFVCLLRCGSLLIHTQRLIESTPVVVVNMTNYSVEWILKSVYISYDIFQKITSEKLDKNKTN